MILRIFKVLQNESYKLLFNIANSQVIENLHLLYTYAMCLKENSMAKESSTMRSEKDAGSKSQTFRRFHFHIMFIGQ